MQKKQYLEDLRQLLSENKKGNNYIDICLQYAERLIDNNLPVIFDIKHFSLLIGIEIIELTKMLFVDNLYYKERNIPKKNGTTRKLMIPALQLKYIQRWILDNILNNIHISKHATGFCKNKSIVDNANQHTGQDCIINTDIKDFFPTIIFERIFRIFVYYGYTKEVSYLLSKLCTYNGVLPQGSPASPCLSNIVCLKLDKRLSSLAEKYEANYTRYADDITFSGNCGIKKCVDIIETILRDEGFEINNTKTRILYKYQKQEVTGLIVNSGNVKVCRKYKRKLKQEIHFCLKFGVAEHLKKINCNKAFYKEHLYGKAFFVNMVEPDTGKKIFKSLESIKWDY